MKLLTSPEEVFGSDYYQDVYDDMYKEVDYDWYWAYDPDNNVLYQVADLFGGKTEITDDVLENL